jgi:hypothetical protein
MTALLVALVLAAAGCSRVKVVPREEVPAGEAEIMKVVTLYSAYRQANGGKPPANAAALKAWAKKLKKEDLSQRGITDVDQAFVSPRDKLPFVTVPPSGSLGVVAFERKGADGKRFVGTAQGSAIEIDENYFREQVPRAPK